MLNMLIEAKTLIDADEFAAAYEQVMDIWKKTDGALRPPDFVEGPASASIAEMLAALAGSL
jgi:hypothetical protein